MAAAESIRAIEALERRNVANAVLALARVEFLRSDGQAVDLPLGT